MLNDFGVLDPGWIFEDYCGTAGLCTEAYLQRFEQSPGGGDWPTVVKLDAVGHTNWQRGVCRGEVGDIGTTWPDVGGGCVVRLLRG